MKLRVGFQGERSAYSEQAIYSFFPDHKDEIEVIPCKDFEKTFISLENNECDCIVIPIENSLGGTLYQNWEYLFESHERNPNLQIRSNIIEQISHCLCAAPGVDLASVTHVYSHPQALAQCRHYLNAHGLDARPFTDTAGAARHVSSLPTDSQNTQGNAAALCSSIAAERYGLTILARGVQDRGYNCTRFWCVSYNQPTIPLPHTHNTLTALAVCPREGQVMDVGMCVGNVSLGGVTVRKIDIRPHVLPLTQNTQTPFPYKVYLELEGESECVREVIAGLKDMYDVREFGCY